MRLARETTSLPPYLPARLLACLPAGRPADQPTYLPIPTVTTYLQYLPTQFHRELFVCSMRFFKEKVMHVTLEI